MYRGGLPERLTAKHTAQPHGCLLYTSPQLAAKICVTPSAIANYENGISTPKPDILISLINVLEVDANYIYSDYLGHSQVRNLYDQDLNAEEIDSIQKYKRCV